MTVCIVDYGSGNLRSAAKAFERAVAEAGMNETIQVTADPSVVAVADRIVLPGVGAFADCKAGLSAIDGMVDALRLAVIERGQPFLGICVGMQLMAERGLEHGETDGLGWINGTVEAMKPSDITLKIPHMGWNELIFSETRHPVLKGLRPAAHVYFVHTYQFNCTHAGDILASAEYGGPVTAAVGRDNLIGTQFHPEKSQANGLNLITNFVHWMP